MPFGSERHLVETNPLRALFFRWYGAVSVGDKIRAGCVFRVLRPLLNAKTDRLTVLDAGCGEGFYSMRLAQEYPHLSITAIDVKEEKIRRVKRAISGLGVANIQTVVQSLLGLTDHDRYDLALCVDVLEHIEQDEQAATRLAAALKPGGTLVIHVPQCGQWHYIGPQPDWHVYGHVREGYSLDEISSLLRRAGLELVYHRHSFGFWGALSSDLDERFYRFKPLWLLLLPVILALAWIDVQANHRWGNGLLIVARKPMAGATMGWN
jgi:SAM-dependent methyltransferase